MPDAPENRLLSARLAELAEALRQAPDEDARARLWDEADRAIAAAGAEEEADTALPVMERDLEAVRALLAAWDAGLAALPEWDKAVLKRAMNAFKKRLKLARLDDESTSGGNPLSQGRQSAIAGVRAPEQYPPEVWDRLVRQKRIRDAGGGVYEPV